MYGGRRDYPKFKSHEKILSTSDVVCPSEKLSGTPKRDQSLFSLLLEIESRLCTAGRNDQIEKDRQRLSVNNLSLYCE
jgi:hypothetical protein